MSDEKTIQEHVVYQTIPTNPTGIPDDILYLFVDGNYGIVVGGTAEEDISVVQGRVREVEESPENKNHGIKITTFKRVNISN